MTEQIQLLDVPASAGLKVPTHDEYKVRCRQRWRGPALRDALNNWIDWSDLNTDLTKAMAFWKAHGTTSLSEYLWELQRAWQPEPSRLDPLLDFEEHFQKVFLRRGLVIYCELILNR